MNLEEVEKNIDKEIKSLSKAMSKLNNDWDKEFTPVERMLLIHSCFHMMCVVESNIMKFCNNYLNAFPPISLYKDEEWIDEFIKINRIVYRIIKKVRTYGDRTDDDLATINDFLSRMKIVLLDVDNDKKAHIDSENNPSTKLKIANFNINTTQMAMLEHIIYVIGKIQENLSQLANKKDHNDLNVFFNLCNIEYQDYISNIWPTEKIKIINESKYRSRIKYDIVSELDTHDYGKLFIQSDHSLKAIALLFSNREKKYNHEDLFNVFHAMLAIELLEDINKNPLKYQDFGKTLTQEAKKEILFACVKEIDAAKDDDGNSLLKNKSDWIAPYRIIVEEQLFKDKEYLAIETFFSEINKDLNIKISSDSLSHANIDIYTKPHEKWDSSKSPSPGIVEKRIKIANKFHELYLNKKHEYLYKHK